MTDTKTILLTGGAGFIGSNFARLTLQTTNHTVVVYDALAYSGNKANLDDLAATYSGRYTFVHGDICDRALVDATLKAHSPSVIVHMAAESHVDRSIIDATPFMRTNVLGTQTMLDACRSYTTSGSTPCRFVHVSTDEVYGSLSLDDPSARFTEHTPLAPTSPYAASKASSDMLALAAHSTYGLDVVVTRCSNNFGPNQFPEKIIPLFITRLMRGERVPLYGDGKNVRDWIHVDDHNMGILAAVEHGKSGEVYNLGADNEMANIELTKYLVNAFGFGDEMVEYVQDRPGHDRRYAIDSSKAKRELRWQATRSAFPDALNRTIAWYQDNEDWWQTILASTSTLPPKPQL